MKFDFRDIFVCFKKLYDSCFKNIPQIWTYHNYIAYHRYTIIVKKESTKSCRNRGSLFLVFYLTNIIFALSCQKRTCNLGTCGGRSQYNDISLLQYILVQILLSLSLGAFVIRTGFSENSDHPEKDVCNCARSLTGTVPRIDITGHY